MQASSPESGTKSRRRAERVKHSAEVTFKPRHRSNSKGMLTDLSERGVFVICPEQFYPGTKLVLYLPLDLGKSTKLCMVSGEIVRWSEIEHSFLKGYGVRFDEDISVSSREMLRNYVSFQTHGSVVYARPFVPNQIEGAKPSRTLETWTHRIRGMEPRETTKKIVRRKAAKRTSWIPLVCAFVLGLAVTSGGRFIYASIAEPLTVSQLATLFPIVKGSIDGEKLTAVAGNDWVKYVTPEAKTKHLIQLAGVLQERGLEQAVLVDGQGHPVAMILKNLENRRAPSIRVFE